MDRYKLIPNIRKKSKEILKSLGLKPQRDIEEAIEVRHHTYVSPCLDSQGKEVAFKIRIRDDKITQLMFIKDFWLTKLLTQRLKSLSLKDFHIARFITGSTKRAPEWLVREYFKGEVCGDIAGFKKVMLSRLNPTRMVKIVRSISEISTDILFKAERKIEKRPWPGNYLWYKNVFCSHQKLLKLLISQKIWNRIYDLLSENKRLINENAKFFVHGDLQPPNIVYSQRKIILLDWDHSHIDNPFLDLGFLWIGGWQDKKWQENLLESMLRSVKEKKKFHRLFLIVTLWMLIRMINIVRLEISKSFKERVSKRTKDNLQNLLKIHQKTLDKVLRNPYQQEVWR